MWVSHRLSETACDVQTNAKKRSAALEEVRAAVEELVLAGGHAAELLAPLAGCHASTGRPRACT